MRGWLAIVASGPPLLNHVIYEAAYEVPDGPVPDAPVTGRAGRRQPGGIRADGAHALGAHQNRDGRS